MPGHRDVSDRSRFGARPAQARHTGAGRPTVAAVSRGARPSRSLAGLLVWAAVTALLTATAPPASPACAPTTGAGCDLRSRIASAEQYLESRPGRTGFVLRDRVTGFRYANAAAADLTWTASTIKLAMVVDLLARERAGAVRLSGADRQSMASMLHESDNAAADALWTRYGGPDRQAFNRNFPRYGMTDVRPQRGFGDVYPYWGFQKSSTHDLDRLMNYALSGLAPADTAAVVAEMQRVDDNQRWGVWGAGAGMRPGNKNGWSEEQGGWVANSVGFAGPDQRFTLAVMNDLGGEGAFAEGSQTTTTVSRILLGSGNP